MSITDFLSKLNAYILNPAIELMFAVAFVYFLYGIIRFLSLEVTDKARDDAKRSILWGLVGMLIMFSVYGIIAFVLRSFGISNSQIAPAAKPYLHIQ